MTSACLLTTFPTPFWEWAFLFRRYFPGFGLIPKKLGCPQWGPNSDTLEVGAPSLWGGAGDTKSKGHSWRAGLGWDTYPRRVDAQGRAVLLGHPNSVASEATHGPFEGKSWPALTPTTTHTHTHTHKHTQLCTAGLFPLNSLNLVFLPTLRRATPPQTSGNIVGLSCPLLASEKIALRKVQGAAWPLCQALFLKTTTTPAPTFPLSCGSHHLTLVTVQVQTLWLGKVLQDLIPKSLSHLTSYHSLPKPWCQQSICFFAPGIHSPVCSDCWP